MNIFQSIRDRIGAVIAVGLISVVLCLCGAAFTFYFAPQQALEANRISNLPQMDAGSVQAAAPGAEVLVTGWLAGNPALFADSAFVAYHLEEWDVTPGTSSEETESEPSGSWRTVERNLPDLRLDVNGQAVQILSSSTALLTGSVHEELVVGNGVEEARYEGNWLPEGSLRFRGFYDGDLVTVLGKRGASGGVLPEKLYAGDRVAFEQQEADEAKGVLIAGMVMLACAPIFLVLGGLGAVFGRRARGGIGSGRFR